MFFSRQSSSRLFYSAFVALLLGAGEAQARRGITIINTGSTHSELGSIQKDKLSPEVRMAVEREHYDTVGYQYERFGIFWLDIWNWGGQYIAYNKVSEDGEVVPPEQAAVLLAVEERKLPKPLNYRMPFGLLVIVGLVSLKMIPRFLAKKRQAAAAATPYQPPAAAAQQDPYYRSPDSAPSGGPPPMPPPLPPEEPRQ
jgi:hypothetical protein